MIIQPPACAACKHLANEKGPAKCAAFPGGIPDKIWLDGDPHTKPLKGQKNQVVFEPIKNAKDKKK